MAETAPPGLGLLKSLNRQSRRKLNVRRPGPVTALDIDGQMLRVVQTAPRGNGTEVTRLVVAQLELEPGAETADPQVLGNAIAATLDKLRLKPGSTVMGVPRQSVVLRTLSLPRIEDVRELASMVHMQIGKDLPFRQEDAVIDFKVRQPARLSARSEDSQPRNDASPAATGESAAAAKIEVLVATVRRETVDFYQKVATAAKLKLIALGWMSEANARCVEACRFAEGNGVVALITLRPDELGIDIIAGQSLLFSRGAAIMLQTDSPDPAAIPGEAGAPAKPDAPPILEPAATSPPKTFVDAVTIEVVRSLHSYGGIESESPVTRLVVAGATGQEAAVLEALKDRLNLPCGALDLAEALALPPDARPQATGSVGALGLGLGVNDPQGLPFDFLSPKRPAVQRNMQRIRMLAAGAVFAVLLIALLGLRSHLTNQHLKINRAVQTELSAAEKKRPIYRQMQLQSAALQNWTKEGRDWLEQYAYLSAVLPGSEDLYITALSVSGQGNIHLAVQARSGEILASLDRQLRAAGYEVKPLAITPGNDKFGYNFRSTVELILPAKMKIDLAKVQAPARPADDGSLDPKSNRTNKKGGKT